MTPHLTKRNLLIVMITLLCLVALTYWLYGLFYLTTDNAYVNANVVQIAPRVTGQVTHLYVTNNQYVKSGQALFDIDANLYESALAQHKALEAEAQAKLKIAQITAERSSTLAKKHVISQQEMDTAQANFHAALARLEAETASVKQAALNLQYTTVTAPTNGWIANLSLREGDTLISNQSYFALISDSEYWIDANFKETQLANIRVGQKADIEVDMYPGHQFEGTVESISGGAGNVFSLLPPENSSGNWVKITQRIPVKIRVNTVDPHYPLRIGTSANISLRIHPHLLRS
jgi:membrane fusion protein, multidrug efflux system